MAPVSEGIDEVVDILLKELDFKVHEFESGLEHNGWIVPQKWKPVKAEIWKDGIYIYNGMEHPLGVIGYSTSFKGKVSLKKLKEHLYFHPQLNDSIVYHCDYYYKQWKKDWGFSVSQNFYESLGEGEYEVNLETVFEKGTLKVLDYFLPGETEETIILNAHNCHAGQANDDIAGVVVGIEIFKRLAKKEKRKFSYRLIIAPEHLGTVFYLANLNKKVYKLFKYVIFLEMLGNDNRFNIYIISQCKVLRTPHAPIPFSGLAMLYFGFNPSHYASAFPNISPPKILIIFISSSGAMIYQLKKGLCSIILFFISIALYRVIFSLNDTIASAICS